MTSKASDDLILRIRETPTAKLPVVIETANVPIHLYATDIEPLALDQLIALAESPIPIGFVSAMPDAHLGKGVTVGSVFASDKFISPNAVGVDIGCGICAVPLEGVRKQDFSREDLLEIQKRIKRRIPTGFSQHAVALNHSQQTIDQVCGQHEPSKWLQNEIKSNPKVLDQLGTLGGGNHFLEILYDEKTHDVWLMLHSGSRNIGNVTAQHHDKVAENMMKKLNLPQPRSHGLNYMPVDSEEGKSYLKDMEWCQSYAFHNRQMMMEIMVDEVLQVKQKAQPNFSSAVNIHHNYCACEECSFLNPETNLVEKRRLWISRKGATSAKKGEIGVIPGSMGVGSFITIGKGSSKSWNSCSHGAGRKLSRNQAFLQISQEEFVEFMSDLSIVCDTNPKVRDEAPQAYKDLNLVMQSQHDLAQIKHRLLPMLNIKGIESKSRSTRKSP